MYEERELQWDDVIEKRAVSLQPFRKVIIHSWWKVLNVEGSHQKKATSYRPVTWQP